MTRVSEDSDAEISGRPDGAGGSSRVREFGERMKNALPVLMMVCLFTAAAYAATSYDPSSAAPRREQFLLAANTVAKRAPASPPAMAPPSETPAAVVEPVETHVPGYAVDAPPPAADSRYQVQAILVAKTSAILSSAIDGKIVDFPYKSGDAFKKGDVLARFDCSVDQAKLKEVEARARLSEMQVKAYSQLRQLQTVAEIELQTAMGNHAQNQAQIEQIKSRLALCRVVAPFDGIVTHKMVNQYEFVQTGRVLMDIASREPLQAEFLAPSVWLRWLNIDTPLSVYIDESGRRYDARLIRISGEVDPVSQSVQVVAEMGSYHEELLPGMSGRATFSTDGLEAAAKFGYHGLITDPRFPSPKKRK